MPIRSKRADQESGGFTIVFKLAREPASRSVSAVGLRTRGSSFARELVDKRKAHPVLGDRSPLSDDPILGSVYVMSGGDMAESSTLIQEIEEGGGIERVYVAPPREVFAGRGTYIRGGDPIDDTWQARIKLPEAQKLA